MMGANMHTTNIVGWDNKRNLINEKEKLAKYNKQIGAKQPIQQQVYFYSDDNQTKECVNIIAVENLRKLSIPFQTGNLIKISDSTPLKPRTQSGGWSEVQEVPSGLLEVTSSALKENEEEELFNKVSESLKDSSETRQKRLKEANKRPEVIQIISKGFKRNSDVIAEVLDKANGEVAPITWTTNQES